tara:strand:- start:1227 stop:1415 length:189 start_codon:yes stop_codon:yes gene_type:complete
MSRRQYTTLTFSVTLPVPQGMSQKDATAAITEQVKQLHMPALGGFATAQVIIKVTDKRVTYL